MAKESRFNENKEVLDSLGQVVNIGDTIAYNMWGSTGYDRMSKGIVGGFTPTGMPKVPFGSIKGAFVKVTLPEED